MVELKNKKITYEYTSSSEDYKVYGTINYGEDTKNINIQGSINDMQDTFIGNFWYNDSESKINKSYSEVSKQDYDKIESFVDTTISEIILKLNS